MNNNISSYESMNKNNDEFLDVRQACEMYPGLRAGLRKLYGPSVLDAIQNNLFFRRYYVNSDEPLIEIISKKNDNSFVALALISGCGWRNV